MIRIAFYNFLSLANPVQMCPTILARRAVTGAVHARSSVRPLSRPHGLPNAILTYRPSQYQFGFRSDLRDSDSVSQYI